MWFIFVHSFMSCSFLQLLGRRNVIKVKTETVTLTVWSTEKICTHRKLMLQNVVHISQKNSQQLCII